MRLLWSLPKAAPAILRHLVAYAELAGQDLERTQIEFKTRLLASAILGICVFFLLLCGCFVVVALTWDTRYRVSAIAGMGGVFLLGAIVAALYRGKIIGVQSEFFGTVRKEWAEDRLILEKILSEQD